MSESDASFTIDADVPAFLKDIDEMAQGAQSRFKKLSSAIKGVLGLDTGKGGAWQHTPIAKTTREMESQHKISLEMLKVERQRRDIRRAERFADNRGRYGEGVDLTEEGELRRQRRNERRQRVSGYVATGINTFANVANAGGSNASIAQGVGTLAGMGATIAGMPELKPIIDATAGVFVNAFEKQAMFREQALRRYQVGGRTGMDVDEGAEMDATRKRYGFDITGFSNLYTRGARAGAFGSGARPKDSMIDMMRGEAAFGVGNNMVSMFGAAQRSGSSGDNSKSLGLAFGLAVQEGLSRGRLGEVFDQMTSAIEANTEASTDMQDTADRFLFISQLGDRYKGNTGAARDMEQSVRGLAKGSMPYTQMTALGAAGFGKGKSYAEALLSTQKGVGTSGGVGSEALISQNFEQFVPAYSRADAAGKANIVLIASTLTGMSGPKVQAILDRLSAGPMDQTDAYEGKKRFGELARAPRDLIAPRTDRAVGEDMLRFGVGRGVLSTSGISASEADSRVLSPTAEAVKSGVSDVVAESNTQKFGQFEREGGRFGAQRDTGNHPGEDLVFPPNTEVRAPFDGMVTNVGSLPAKGDGWFVHIKARDSYRLVRLVHLDPPSIKVSRNQRVKQGDPIGKTLQGKVWQNGVEKHLHVGYEENGKTVDPMRMPELDKIVDPTVLSSGGSQGGVSIPIPGKGGVDMSPAERIGASIPIPGKGTVQMSPVVKIEIHDHTRDGVDVKREVQQHAESARRPAPGDTPAQRR